MATAAEILSPAVTPPAAPLQTGATVQPTNEPAANSGAWYESVQDTELKGWLSNKKYESPEMAAKAAWSLERLLGADKADRTFVLPKDDTDAEGIKAFRAKIGVPETPEGYKLPLPEGQTDDAFAKAASKWFHANGVPAKAAEGIVKEWNTFMQGEMQRMDQLEKAQAEAKLNDLKTEWAHNFDERAELGRRGLKAIGEQSGLDDSDLKKLESAIGTDKILKMFWKLGEVGKEGTGTGGNHGGQFGTSKQSAQEQLNDIMDKRQKGEINDFVWQKEYFQPGGKIEQLTKVLTA